jgi:hypothetical protein
MLMDQAIAAVLPGGLVVLTVPKLCRVRMKRSGRVVSELMDREDARALVRSINRGRPPEKAEFVTYGSLAQILSS